MFFPPLFPPDSMIKCFSSLQACESKSKISTRETMHHVVETIVVICVAMHMMAHASLCDRPPNRQVLNDLFWSTSGATWTSSSRLNWNTTNDISTWGGISCVGPSVNRIGLDHSNLTGTLPGSIGLLVNVTYMYFGQNQLGGTLPAEFSSLKNLKTLNINGNQLSGTLPPEWSALTQLEQLFLYTNKLSGTLPPEWSALTQLSLLFLFENQLTGTLPAQWSALSKLSALFVYQNQLRGSLPSQWGSLTSLYRFDAYQNELTGTLPSTWSSLNKLRVLDLGGNRFSGSLPPAWSLLTSFLVINLYQNGLSGTLPASWSSLLLLSELRLHANAFSGSLPAAWASLTSLSVLDLHQNQLSGTLPEAWSALGLMQRININTNNLTGALPASWSRLTNMTSISLCENRLSGTLPTAWWSSLAQLLELDLHQNQLSGTIPSGWNVLVRLSMLDLSSNDLSGTISFEFSNSLLNLSFVNLSSNHISGPVPSSWLTCSSPIADLHGNSFRNTPLDAATADAMLRCNNSINLCGNICVINRTTIDFLQAQGQWMVIEAKVFPRNCSAGCLPSLTASSSLTYSPTVLESTSRIIIQSASLSDSKRSPSDSSSMSRTSQSTTFVSASGVSSGSISVAETGTFTSTRTCPPNFGIVSSAALLLVTPDAGGSSLFLASTPIPVGAFIDASAFVVQVRPSPGVRFLTVGNASSSRGLVTNISIGAIADFLAILVIPTHGGISLTSSSQVEVNAEVLASGPCVAEGHHEWLRLTWTISPLPPPTALVAATMTTFRTSTVVAAVFGNPVTAMTTTGLVSILALGECMFSDVDPLETSVSPVTTAAVGPVLGQYYRGAVVVALTLYGGVGLLGLCGSVGLWAFRTSRKDVSSTSLLSALAPHMATLRYPSIGMVVVGLFGQGLATCGVSLIRLNNSAGDVWLGAVSLIVCTGLVVGTGWVTTLGLEVRIVKLPRSSRGWRRQALAYLRWGSEWEDVKPLHFKARYQLVIRNLVCPWWTAVELSSCVVQGSILGIRKNSLAVCRGQLWSLAFHCLAMLAAAAYFRPCGSKVNNAFLVLSKLESFVVATLLLLHALTLDGGFASGAEVVTSVSIAIEALHILLRVITALLNISPTRLRHSAHDRDHQPEIVGLQLHEKREGSETFTLAGNEVDEETGLTRIMAMSGACGAMNRREIMRHLLLAVDRATTLRERLEHLIQAAGTRGRSRPPSFQPVQCGMGELTRASEHVE